VRTFAVGLVAALAALALGVSPASAAARECEGLMICVPRIGPWVVVPTDAGAERPRVEYQMTCPRGYVIGGISADLSQRAIDVTFIGALGSPVNPGITTSRSITFVATYVGSTARAPTFRPRIGCMPASGGGIRIPTSVTAFPPSKPTVRRVRNVRVRPGASTVSRSCVGRERIVGASHAFAFFTTRPPEASLVAGVAGTQTVEGNQTSVRVSGDAELGAVRAVVQVQAICTGVS
jgi:hypothetical protein